MKDDSRHRRFYRKEDEDNLLDARTGLSKEGMLESCSCYRTVNYKVISCSKRRQTVENFKIIGHV